MAKVRITQLKSKNGSTKRQKANLEILGIRRMHQSVEVELTPASSGRIEKIRHLVKIEEI